MSSKKNTSIVWFRNNLRVEDNLALYNAVNQSDKVIGYVNIDPNNFKYTQYGFKKTEKYRAKFLLESISDLKQNLNHLNISLIIDFKEIGSAKDIAEIVKFLLIDESKWMTGQIIPFDGGMSSVKTN